MAIYLKSFFDQLATLKELVHILYLNLEKLVQNEKAKMVLSYMAVEKIKHRDHFQAWKTSGGGSLVFPEGDLELSEMLEIPEVKIDALSSQEECFNFVIRLEEACIRLYRWLTDLQPEGKERNILEKIIAEEEAYKRQYERLSQIHLKMDSGS